MLHGNQWTPRKPEATTSTHENLGGKKWEVRFWPFFDKFSLVGLALGFEFRWFHIIFACFSAQKNSVNRKHPIVNTQLRHQMVLQQHRGACHTLPYRCASFFLRRPKILTNVALKSSISLAKNAFWLKKESLTRWMNNAAAKECNEC